MHTSGVLNCRALMRVTNDARGRWEASSFAVTALCYSVPCYCGWSFVGDEHKCACSSQQRACR
jgi:hypothetical protein